MIRKLRNAAPGRFCQATVIEGRRKICLNKTGRNAEEMVVFGMCVGNADAVCRLEIVQCW
jgi:hypothetical protein